MNKKGFTLVELLGVIIVLGVIAMITIPKVTDSIKEARKNAFGDSVKAMLVSIQNYQAEHLTDNDMDLKKGVNLNDLAERVEIKNVSEYLSSEFGGTGSTTGGFIVSDNGTPEAVGIGNSDFCANGKKNSLTITDGPCEPTLSNYLLLNPANWESGEFGYSTGVKVASTYRIRFKYLIKIDKPGLYDYTYPEGKVTDGCQVVLRPYENSEYSSYLKSLHAIAKPSGKMNLRTTNGYNYFGIIIYSVDPNNNKICRENWNEYQTLLNSDDFNFSLTYFSE